MSDVFKGNEGKRSLENKLIDDLEKLLEGCKPHEIKALKKRIDTAISEALVKPVVSAGWHFPDSQRILLRQKYVNVIPIVINVLAERGISDGQISEGGSRFDFTLQGRPAFMRIGDKSGRIYVTLYFSAIGEARKFSRRVGEGKEGKISDFRALLSQIVDKGMRGEWER